MPTLPGSYGKIRKQWAGLPDLDNPDQLADMSLGRTSSVRVAKLRGAGERLQFPKRGFGGSRFETLFFCLAGPCNRLRLRKVSPEDERSWAGETDPRTSADLDVPDEEDQASVARQL